MMPEGPEVPCSSPMASKSTNKLYGVFCIFLSPTKVSNELRSVLTLDGAIHDGRATNVDHRPDIPGTQMGLPVGKCGQTCECHVSSSRHTEPDARVECIYSVVTCTTPPCLCNPITTHATCFSSRASPPHEFQHYHGMSFGLFPAASFDLS